MPTAHTYRRSWRAIAVVGLLVVAGCSGSAEDTSLRVEPDVSLQPVTATTPTPEAGVGESEVGLPVTPTPPAGEDVTASAETVSATSCLSPRQRVAQLLLPLLTQPELAGAQAFAASGELGGIGLLGSPDQQLAELLEALQLSSFVPVLVASDEEGGSVQRLADLLGPIPSAASDAQSKTPEDVRRQWVEYGSRVRALGIDVVFGPVLDVGSAPGIASRSYGADPAVVAQFGRAVAAGLIEAGIVPVFKHFPGHGRATADSHLELPTTPSIAELRQVDLVPYQELLSDAALGDQLAVMVGHLSVPGLTNGAPTSLSVETVTGLLRGELGFDGLVFTDALNMGAIVNTYGELEALELALLAGADIMILGSLANLSPALDHLVQRFEVDEVFAQLINNRAERVLAAKGQGDLCTGAR